MVVVPVAPLFAALGSAVALVTVAVFEIVVPVARPALDCTLTVIVAVPARAIVPSVQVTVAVPVHDPWDGVAETNEVFAGMVSETVTAAASDGPLLDTVSV